MTNGSDGTALRGPAVKDQMVMVPGDRPYILIVPTDEGGADVRGPLNNPVFFYGLLEFARDVCFRRSLEQFGTSGGKVLLSGGPTPPGSMGAP